MKCGRQKISPDFQADVLAGGQGLCQELSGFTEGFPLRRLRPLTPSTAAASLEVPTLPGSLITASITE